MPVAPLPDNEAARLQALRELLILDTPPEQRFDRIVEFAQQEFEVPTVLMSLVDENRLWFKARLGQLDCEAPREGSFCSHAILKPELLVIEDTLLDPRFAKSGMVVGPPFVRFYAGAPLEPKPGLRIGTLCLIDQQPHAFDAADRAILGSLRELMQAELLSQSGG